MCENKFYLIFLTVLISSFGIVSPFSDPKCGQLSNGCELKSYYCNDNSNNNSTKCHFYVCDKIDANFQFAKTEMNLIRNCSLSHPEINEALNDVYFRLSVPSILDGSFDLSNNHLFLTSMETTFDTGSIAAVFQEGESSINKVIFRYIKGFDTGIFKKRTYPIRMDFYYSNFDFYLNRSLIRSCEYVEKLDDIPQYIFNAFWVSEDNYSATNDVRFYNCEYKTPICPLTILYLQISIIRIFGIQNTYYKSNYPKFLSVSDSYLNLTEYFITPLQLDLVNMQKIELNSVIVNTIVFNKIFILRLFGDVLSIEPGLFKSFKNLKVIHLDLIATRKVIHRCGIDWILDLNADVKVDVRNRSLAKGSYADVCVAIMGYIFYEQGLTTSVYMSSYEYFPDEDFCLYARFPFQQLILMTLNFATKYIEDCSCSYLWLTQYNRLINKICNETEINIWSDPYLIIGNKNIKNKMKECNFQQR